jgi:hypothetical protein
MADLNTINEDHEVGPAEAAFELRLALRHQLKSSGFGEGPKQRINGGF